MKSPIQYFGAKGNIAEKIIGLMPEHRGYIEPYAGSLSVLLAKPESKIEVVNDLDGDLVTFWRVLRDRGPELIRAAALTPHSRKELDQSYDFADIDELEVARRVWVLLTQGRSRTMRNPGWRFYLDPNGTSASFQTYLSAYRDRLVPAMERLAKVTLECRPALDVIDDYGSFEDNLLYVDPPYVVQTRSSAYGTRYRHEMRDDDHRLLAGHLHDCSATVILSGYPSDLYDALFPGWNQVRIGATTANGLKTKRTEVVWSNRPLETNFLFHGDGIA